MFELLLPSGYLWILIVGFLMAFVLSFGIGANDVANTFGTSVGAKVLTLKQACIIATFCETLGAMMLGLKVSDTIQTGFITPSTLERLNNETDGYIIFVCGQVSALTGSCSWLLIATILKMPVSGTHSIVGAIIGYIVMSFGVGSIRWMQIVRIVSSWFISPVSSGIVTLLLFLAIEKLILKNEDKIKPGLRFLPLFYFTVFLINIYSITFDPPSYLNFLNIFWWIPVFIALVTALIVSLLVQFIMVPYEKKRIKKSVDKRNSVKMTTLNNGAIRGVVKEKNIELVKEDGLMEKDSSNEVKDCQEHKMLFSRLQILTAMFGSFVHGGNDVSNSIGPLIGMWLTANSLKVGGESDNSVILLLLYGGLGISVGLWVLGKRVIETVGSDLTTITPSSGVCIEAGSAFIVLLASVFGIPISSTHCKVGSVVFVGRYRAKDNLKWRIFVEIIISWVVTLPASALISALTMFFFQKLVL